MLQSDSGYCMPFEEKGKDVEMSLGYGKQKHPKTGEMFFHHGVDFPVKHYLLSALATGKVTGLGNDAVHGIYQVITSVMSLPTTERKSRLVRWWPFQPTCSTWR